jgi:hypothetical protein
LREVANAFAVHGTTRAPVVDRAAPDRLLGMVELSQLLHARRADHREEHHRERHLAIRSPDATNAKPSTAATSPLTDAGRASDRG